MSNTSEIITIRLFRPDADVPPLVALLTTIAAGDKTGATADEATVRSQLAWLGHDPTRDRWVAEAMKESGCRNLLFASSSSVYGTTARTPFREDHDARREVAHEVVVVRRDDERPALPVDFRLVGVAEDHDVGLVREL